MPGNNPLNALEEATLNEIVLLNLNKELDWNNIQKQYKERLPRSHKTALQLCAGWKEIIKKSKCSIDDEILKECVNNPICKRLSGKRDINWDKVTELYNEKEHPYHKLKKQLYERWTDHVSPDIRKITGEERQVIYAFFERTFGQFIRSGKVSHKAMLAALMTDNDFINFHKGKVTQETAPGLHNLKNCYYTYLRAKRNKEAKDAGAMSVERPCTDKKLLANMDELIPLARGYQEGLPMDIGVEDAPTDWETLYSRQEAALSTDTHFLDAGAMSVERPCLYEKLLPNMDGFIPFAHRYQEDPLMGIDVEDAPADWETLYSSQAALSMDTPSPSPLAEQLNINEEIFLDIVNNAPHLTMTDWINISEEYNNRLVPELPQEYLTLCNHWKMLHKDNIDNDEKIVDTLLEECVNESYRNFGKHRWQYISELYNRIALIEKDGKQLNDRWHRYLNPSTKSLTEEDKEIVLRFFKTDLSAFRTKEGKMDYKGIQAVLMMAPDIVALHTRIYGSVYPLRCYELQSLYSTVNRGSSAKPHAASSSLRFFNSTPAQPSWGPLCSTTVISA